MFCKSLKFDRYGVRRDRLSECKRERESGREREAEAEREREMKRGGSAEGESDTNRQ